jgi:hypothetical protein
MAITLVITGDKETNAKLAKLAGPDQKKAIRKASREALRPVLAQVKATAPRRTGALSRAAKIRAITRSRVRIGSMVTVTGTGKGFSGKAFYGGFIEYGWKSGRRVRNSDLKNADGTTLGGKKRRTEVQKAIAWYRDGLRNKIPGTQWMKKSADAKKEEALANYRYELDVFIADAVK